MVVYLLEFASRIKVCNAIQIVSATIVLMKTLLTFVLNCPFSIQIWRLTGIWEDIHQACLKTMTIFDALFLLLQRLATITWNLWKHQNLKLWQDVSKTSEHVIK